MTDESYIVDCELQSIIKFAFEDCSDCQYVSRKRERSNERERRKQIARAVKKRLVVLISFLSALVGMLIYGAGETLWPAWVVEYRSRIIAILLLVLICLIVLFPIMIEASTNPRTLSGPGDGDIPFTDG